VGSILQGYMQLSTQSPSKDRESNGFDFDRFRHEGNRHE
jgi:hypothetical protein